MRGNTRKNLVIALGAVAAIAASLLALGLSTKPAPTPVASSETSEPAPSNYPKPAKLPQITLDNLDPDLVRITAYEITQKKWKSSTPEKDFARHVLTPNVDQESANLAISKIPRMAGFYKDVATVTDYTFVWASTKDAKKIPKLLCEQTDYCEQSTPIDYCSAGGQETLYAFCAPPKSNINLFVMYLLHSYTHAVQSAITNEHQPNWFIEGTATYFEGHFSADHYKTGFEYFMTQNQVIIDKMINNQKLVRFSNPPTKKNFIDALGATENDKPADGFEQAQLGYYPGALAVEALVASYGIEKFNEFWASTRTKDFYEAFEESFGLTTKQFHKKLAPYAVAMYKKDPGRLR